mgnify:CR=1 FL=1
MSSTSFRKISDWGKLFTRTHLSDVGSIYVPKNLGGVTVRVDNTTEYTRIILRPNGEPWKRYVYIGIANARDIFEQRKCKSSTLLLQLEWDGQEAYWFATIKK